jgi:prepilin-type N-terminal cleavage/methylation domain-containing protein
MNKLFKKDQSGFTLIELLVVSTIIIAVSAIGLTSYSGVSQGARDAKRKSDLDDVRTTLLLFRSENGYYPTAAVTTDPRVATVKPRRLIASLSDAFDVPDAFEVKEVQAALFDNGYTPPPIDDGGTTREPIGTIDPIWEEATATPAPTGIEIIKTTPTPTPPVGCVYEEVQCIQAPCDPVLVCVSETPILIGPPLTPTPTPVVEEKSTPTPDPETRPAAAKSYDDMVDELVFEGYLDSDDVAYDPVNDNEFYYGYVTPDILSFELTATLEKDNTIIRLTN